jgi:LPS sulfotransferase NodH
MHLPVLSDSCLFLPLISGPVHRGECACNPVRFFVIISMQRSGSGWFETLLNSHPNVSSNGEIFSVRDRRENISSIFETLDRLYDMDWLTSAAKNECTAAFGLKWMLNQVKLYHSFTRVRVMVTISERLAFQVHIMFGCCC